MSGVTQRDRVEACLGEGHGLKESEIDRLVRDAEEIAERYPDPGDAELRDAALTMACELYLRTNPAEVVAEYARARAAARLAEARALAALRQGARMLVFPGAGRGLHTQMGYARIAGVDRSVVIEWSGRPNPR